MRHIASEYVAFDPLRLSTLQSVIFQPRKSPETLMAYTNPQHIISTENLASAMLKNAANLKVFDVTVTLVPNPFTVKGVL